MKLFTACTFLASLIASAAASTPDIPADSTLGKHLISHARRLDQNADEYAHQWIAGYSIKFQGCHSVKQWNGDANGNEDVRIATKNLVRFRLCPSESCSATKAAGCTAGYGDYVVDMDTFLQGYMEGARQYSEYECQQYLQNTCGGCEEGDGDDFNPEYCEYDCFNDAGMTQCIDRNPYEENGENNNRNQQFNIDEYMQCKEVKAQNNNKRRRHLDDANVQYFVGPYCANQGGSILLGMFTDDSCTVAAAAEVSFYDLVGIDLPYNKTSMITSSCLSCQEHKDNDKNNENDQADVDAVSESCETLYTTAGKCEASLPDGKVTTPNNNACTYMEGIRITRQDGIIDVGSATRPSAVATSFIVVFAMAFCATAFYVWYLRTRLGLKKDALLS